MLTLFHISYQKFKSKKKKKINKILPSFEEVVEKDIYFQSASQTKKLYCQAQVDTKLNKNKS